MSEENKSITNLLKYTFLVHAIVALIFGLPMLLAPGRFLDIFNWAPVDPLLTRLLGAALLALGWSSVRGYLASSWSQVSFIVEAEIVFCVLGCIGFLRHLFVSGYPFIVWFVCGVLLIFAILWIAGYLINRR